MGIVAAPFKLYVANSGTAAPVRGSDDLVVPNAWTQFGNDNYTEDGITLSNDLSYNEEYSAERIPAYSGVPPAAGYQHQHYREIGYGGGLPDLRGRGRGPDYGSPVDIGGRNKGHEHRPEGRPQQLRA